MIKNERPCLRWSRDGCDDNDEGKLNADSDDMDNNNSDEVHS